MLQQEEKIMDTFANCVAAVLITAFALAVTFVVPAAHLIRSCGG